MTSLTVGPTKEELSAQLATAQKHFDECLVQVKEYQAAQAARAGGATGEGAGVYRGPTENATCDEWYGQTIRELQQKLDPMVGGAPATSSPLAGDVSGIIESLEREIASKTKIPIAPGFLSFDPITGRFTGHQQLGPKYFGVEIKYDAGAAPGANPAGPIVDLHITRTVRVGPIHKTSTTTTQVSISKDVKDTLSSPMGGKAASGQQKSDQQKWVDKQDGGRNPND